MPRTDAQKRARANYMKKVSRMEIQFYPADAELYEFVKSKPAMAGYVKDLIRADMERVRGEGAGE